MGDDDAEFLAVGDALADLLEREAGLTPTASVLDVGCGYGRLAHALVRRGFRGRYVGLDVLGRHIEWCSRNLGSRRMRFSQVDVQNERYNPGGGSAAAELDLGSARFDVVALFSVFTHMWPDDVEAYLRLVASALSPANGEGNGGRALTTFFLLDDEWRRLDAQGRPDFALPHERTAFCRYGSEEEPLHRVGYERDWVVTTARAAGLAVVGAPRYGSWSARDGVEEADGYQDIVVFARAGASDPPVARAAG